MLWLYIQYVLLLLSLLKTFLTNTVIEPLQKVVQCEQFRLYAAQGYEEAQMC